MVVCLLVMGLFLFFRENLHVDKKSTCWVGGVCLRVGIRCDCLLCAQSDDDVGLDGELEGYIAPRKNQRERGSDDMHRAACIVSVSGSARAKAHSNNHAPSPRHYWKKRIRDS